LFKKICPHCNCREHKSGEKTYYHQIITPVIISPVKKQVINLEPEFIRKQDGNNKEDCENAGIKRWLLRNKVDKNSEKITLLGDDLYSRQTICELVKEQGYNFIFVALPSSHKSLYEWINYLQNIGEITQGEIKKYPQGQGVIYRYKYVNNVPLRELEPSLMVNWFEVEMISINTNKVIYKNSWVTNHQLKESGIEAMIIAGKTRWKIENECNNTLKNQGYNLSHNFGHGQSNLAETLLSLNLIAFLFHNVLELVNEMYQKIRENLGKRTTFFNDIKALLKYIWFESWSDLFIFIITEGAEKKLINSS
jgi:hypothetical protein